MTRALEYTLGLGIVLYHVVLLVLERRDDPES
jgi:hypothetical protein